MHTLTLAVGAFGLWCAAAAVGQQGVAPMGEPAIAGDARVAFSKPGPDGATVEVAL